MSATDEKLPPIATLYARQRELEEAIEDVIVTVPWNEVSSRTDALQRELDDVKAQIVRKRASARPRARKEEGENAEDAAESDGRDEAALPPAV